MAVENCIFNFVAAAILLASITKVSIVIKELPVFKPNDYFFEHHQKEGEE